MAFWATVTSQWNRVREGRMTVSVWIQATCVQKYTDQSIAVVHNWVVATQIFLCSPRFGGNPIWRSYFSDGLKPPARQNTILTSDIYCKIRILTSKIRLYRMWRCVSIPNGAYKPFHNSAVFCSRLLWFWSRVLGSVFSKRFLEIHIASKELDIQKWNHQKYI